jgi:hypothetical protein
MADTMNYDSFLQTSKIADIVKLPVTIVVQETKLSPNDLVEIEQSGVYGPVNKKELVCKLEVGGQTLANGKIIKKGGEYFFKIIELIYREEK